MKTTSSGWQPYPGFEVFPYPEYSQVFFGGDYRVLRGGSFGTDPAAVRSTFRNWDHPVRRQIFSGFRCARDATPAEIAEGTAAAIVAEGTAAGIVAGGGVAQGREA